MVNTGWFGLTIVFLLAVSVAVGCALETPVTAALQATVTPAPTYTPLPTYTPYPTYTPVPTATPVPTPPAAPTITPIPEPAPLPTSTPDPTAAADPTRTPRPRPTATPAPTAAPTQQPRVEGVKYIDDPEVPYLKWEVGPEVLDEHYRYLRAGIVYMHQYADPLGVFPLPGDVTFYLYQNTDLQATTLARVQNTSVERARESFASLQWAGIGGIEDAVSGFIIANPQSIIQYNQPYNFMRIAAHELVHAYQYMIGDLGKFHTSRRSVSRNGPAWLLEGVAEFQTMVALADHSVWPYERRREHYAREARDADVPLHETEIYADLRDGRFRSSQGVMAAELLASETSARSLIRYYALLGPDTTWQEAFETTFGMTVDEFYPLFEEHRADGFPELDLPDLAPRIPLATADREVLATLYDVAGGVNWETNDNWLTDEPGSKWHGVATDREGYVTVLDLTDNRLSGDLPAELADLSRLRELRLRDNQLSGEIPPELGNLFNLEVLSLERNRLSGTIPPSLGNLVSLKQLRIWSNELNGEIPSTLANLSELRSFSVGGNELTGEIPLWLGDLPNLRSVHLSENVLTGPIPDNLAKLTDVVYFNVNRNRLTGEIPSWLADFPLRQLYLNDNQLTGEIPNGLSDLPDLEWLWLGGNSLSGCVPSALRDIPNHDMERLGLPDC